MPVSAWCRVLLVVLALSPILGACGGDPKLEWLATGAAQFDVSGPASPAGTWNLDGLQSYKLMGGDLSAPRDDNKMFVDFVGTRPSDNASFGIFLSLPFSLYTGAGTYSCGNPPAFDTACRVGVTYERFSDTAAYRWSPTADCTFVVLRDDDTGFEGTLDCTDMFVWQGSQTACDVDSDPSCCAPLTLSGTWSFPCRSPFEKGTCG